MRRLLRILGIGRQHPTGSSQQHTGSSSQQDTGSSSQWDTGNRQPTSRGTGRLTGSRTPTRGRTTRWPSAQLSALESAPHRCWPLKFPAFSP